MNGVSNSLQGLLAIVLLWPAGWARADVREGVEQFRSGEAVVTTEWFAPPDGGRFPNDRPRGLRLPMTGG
jgi:hypothetical protein